jgi:hypothetical protein
MFTGTSGVHETVCKITATFHAPERLDEPGSGACCAQDADLHRAKMQFVFVKEGDGEPRESSGENIGGGGS